MTPQELKNSILQLAIQGKLVEQRSEEGMAEELYRRIQEEKRQLIKEGKIKKGKPLPEISEDEVPFEIPESWKWVRIGNIALLNPKNDLKDDLKVSFIPMALISDGFQNRHSHEIRQWKEIKKGFTHFADGDIGIAKITPCFQNRKSVIFSKLQNGHGAGTTELSIVRVIDNLLLREYLLYFFKSAYFIENGIKSFTGTAGQQRIHKDYLPLCLFPFPPLAEQKRIVAKIEELLPYINRYEQAWNRLEALNKRFPEDMKKSLLQYAIEGKLLEQRPEEGTAEELYRQIQEEKRRLVKEGKIKKEKPLPEISEDEVPFEIPESWKWVKLGDVLREVIVPMRDKPTFSKEGVPWCRIEDRDGFLLNGSKSNQLVSDETIRNMNLKVFPVGTVLSACTGGSIGTSVINTIECCTNQTFNGLVCSSGLFNWYLFWYLKTQFNALRKVGTGTTIAYVSQKKSKEMLLPLPPLAEQKRIVAKLEELLAMCKRLK